MAAKKQVFPKKLGEAVDRLYALREERLVLERQAEELKSQETALKDHLIATFGKSGLEGAAGAVARCSVTQAATASVVDWEALRAWVKKTGAWELLQKRVNDVAYRERLEAGEAVPGVETFMATRVSCTRIKR
jgi:hypothetical protein